MQCLTACNIVFCSAYTDSSVQKAYRSLLQMFQGLGECNVFDPQPEFTENFGVEEQELNDIHEESEEKTMSGSYQRPFGPFFAKHLDKAFLCSSNSFPRNPLYYPMFMEKLSNNWLPLAPFWSGIMRDGTGITNIFLQLNFIQLIH